MAQRVATCVFAVVIGCGSVAAQSAGGFVSLFDGKTLEGWVPGPDQKVWSVSDGVLHGVGGSSLETEITGLLHTAREYTDYTFRTDVRFVTQGADGGIVLRTSATSKSFQVQLRDGTINRPVAWSGNLARGGGIQGETIFDFDAALRAYRKQGEWDTYEVTVIGQRLTTKINGVQVMEAYKMPPTGFISLLVEVGQLEFRNIQIREGS